MNSKKLPFSILAFTLLLLITISCSKKAEEIVSESPSTEDPTEDDSDDSEENDAPKKMYLYVSNVNESLSGNESVTAYEINLDTGLLSPLSTSSTLVGGNPYDLYVSPNSKNLYVANAESNTLSLFSITSSTGVLSPLAPSTVSQSQTPFAMVMTPNAQYLYGANGGNYTNGSGSISQYSVNASGGLSALSPASIVPAGVVWFITITPNGRYLYMTDYGTIGSSAADNVYMYEINQSTGQLSALSPATVATEDKPWHINVHPSGNFVYLTNSGSNSISAYSVTSGTGQLVALSPATYSTGGRPIGLSIDPEGRYLYTANETGNSVSMYSINTTTGALTSIASGSISVSGAPYGLEVDLDGKYLYVAQSTSNSIAMFSINQNTGALSPLSTSTISTGKIGPRFIRIARPD